MEELTCLECFVPFNPGVFAVVESGEGVGDNFERLGLLTDTDNVAGLNLVGGDIDYLTVDSNVTVEDDLTGSSTCGSDAEAVNDVVEARLKELKEDHTGDTLEARSLGEEVAELALEDTVSVLGLLLFAELYAVFRGFAALVLTVLAGGKLRRWSTLSSPKMGSPNLRAILVLGPVYLAILFKNQLRYSRRRAVIVKVLGSPRQCRRIEL